MHSDNYMVWGDDFVWVITVMPLVQCLLDKQSVPSQNITLGKSPFSFLFNTMDYSRPVNPEQNILSASK